MITENEFKEALEAIDNSTCASLSKPDNFDIIELTDSEHETIRLALKAMIALMGEPSEDVIAALYCKYEDMYPTSAPGPCNEDWILLFKAMRSAMLAELDKGE